MQANARPPEPLTIVRAFADNALEKGRDRWSGKDSPLFADGIHVETNEPAEWRRDGKRFVVSNLASQQNFFRTLAGLSALTGDDRYAQAARDATEYMFDRFRSPCGLLYWGGHTFVDLYEHAVVPLEVQSMIEPESGKSVRTHAYGGMEIKMHLPFYELLFEVAPQETAQFVRAYWNGDIMDWRRLELNRHAPYGKAMGALWDSPWDDPPAFYESTGHASVMPLTDLTWAAAMLHKASGGQENCLVWARRMAGMLARARHPETGLGAAKYSMLKKLHDVPDDLKGTRESTFTRFGDRVRNQYGAEFGATAREAWKLWGITVRRVYCEYALGQMAIAEQLGEEGRPFLHWTVDGLKAWARHAYVPERNFFRALWADGTDMTGYRDKGFHGYGAEGEIQPIPADGTFLLPLARAWRLSRDAELWETLRGMVRGNGLGTMANTHDGGAAANPGATSDDPLALLAALELHRGTGDEAFLDIARKIAANMIEQRFVNRLFPASPRHLVARFDATEPLALLHLEAAERGEPDRVPACIGGIWRYLQGPYDGHGRFTDQKLFYAPDALLQRRVEYS